MIGLKRLAVAGVLGKLAGRGGGGRGKDLDEEHGGERDEEHGGERDEECDDGKYAGSIFCRPGGLEGGEVPDIGGPGATDELSGARKQREAEAAEDARHARELAAKKAAAAEAAAARKAKRGTSGRGRGGKNAAAAGKPCAILDTNTAVMYGKYANDEKSHRIPEEFRGLLCDQSVKKVVTPAVMNEVWGLCRSGRLAKDAAGRIQALAVKDLGAGREGVADAIEAEQRRVAGEPKCETAVRWLAAKRIQYQKATGTDYGNPSAMRDRIRCRHLDKLCEMAAGDRLIMGEAALAAAQLGQSVLVTADADMSLFAGALRAATGGGVDVVGIECESRRGRGRDWD